METHTWPIAFKSVNGTRFTIMVFSELPKEVEDSLCSLAVASFTDDFYDFLLEDSGKALAILVNAGIPFIFDPDE